MKVLTEQKKKEIMENGYYLLLIQNMEEVNTLMTALKVIDAIPEKNNSKSSVMSNDSNCVGDVCEV